MRIAIATRHRSHVGGVETYLERLLPALAAHRHQLLLAHEFDGAGTPIALPAGTECARLAGLPPAEAAGAVAVWKPDVIFAQGLADAALEGALQRVGPAVLLLHTYHGTCVGGTKTHAFPRRAPCSRRLGPACLLHYFPRRCGGLSPVTMIERYRSETAHLALLAEYRGVGVLSSHMHAEAVAHGARPERVAVLPPPVEGAAASGLPAARTEKLSRAARPGEPLRVLFLGRLEPAKGGDVLIDAAAMLGRRVNRPIELVMVGEGRSRGDWERRADARRGPALVVTFAGRADTAERDRWFAWADLLAVPSLWPEPFGLAGAEGAAAGLPAVAFDVGGTREWLDDGRSGRMVTSGRLDAAGLAEAMAWTIETPERLAALAAGARARAAAWSMERHRDAVERLLSGSAGDRRA